MGVDWNGLLPYLLLALLGFHGIFYFRDPAKKTLSWCLLQGSAFCFAWVSSEGALFRVLALDILAVGFAVALVLFFLGRALPKEVEESRKRKGP